MYINHLSILQSFNDFIFSLQNSLQISPCLTHQERGIMLFKAAAEGDMKTVQKLNAANFQDKVRGINWSQASHSAFFLSIAFIPSLLTIK